MTVNLLLIRNFFSVVSQALHSFVFIFLVFSKACIVAKPRKIGL